MRVLILAVAVSVIGTGCASNTHERTCAWPPDYNFAAPNIDIHIRLGEDIAIRFADAQGYRETWGTTRRQCESKLFDQFAASAQISAHTIDVARRGLDRRGFDAVVNLPMAVFCLLLAVVATRESRRRFGNDNVAFWAGIMLASFGIATLVTLIGQVWAALVEIARIGNGHLSYRAERIPWRHHRLETWTLAFICVWGVAWLTRRSRSGSWSTPA